MTVTCETCGWAYDDTYCWTYCPHRPFKMKTRVIVGGQEYVAHTVEELHALLRRAERR